MSKHDHRPCWITERPPAMRRTDGPGTSRAAPRYAGREGERLQSGTLKRLIRYLKPHR